MLCALFEEWIETQIVSLRSRGFDCRNTSNYVPLLPFPYRIFSSNPPSAFSTAVWNVMEVCNLISQI